MNVEQAVLRKAQEEADAILESARRDADARWRRESARLRADHERRVAATTAQLEAELEREANARRTADRLKLLAVKNEIIGDVFDKAVQGILNLPDNGYAEWLGRQLASLPELQGAVVVAGQRDCDLLGELLNRLGRTDLQLGDKTIPIQGGFLVQCPRADLDYSIEAQLGVLKESLAQQLTAELFQETEHSKQPGSQPPSQS